MQRRRKVAVFMEKPTQKEVKKNQVMGRAKTRKWDRFLFLRGATEKEGVRKKEESDYRGWSERIWSFSAGQDESSWEEFYRRGVKENLLSFVKRDNEGIQSSEPVGRR